MDQELADELGADKLNTFVVTRSGTPIRKSDMERVACGSARTVVIMAEDNDDERKVNTNPCAIFWKHITP